MRIKILLVGDDPASTVADAQLLKERGILPFTTFNPENIEELIDEIQPDVLFFDPHKTNNRLTDIYNKFVNAFSHANIPVIFTLADDDVYLVTKKRNAQKNNKGSIADNIISAVKQALQPSKSSRKTFRLPHQTIALPSFVPRA